MKKALRSLTFPLNVNILKIAGILFAFLFCSGIQSGKAQYNVVYNFGGNTPDGVEPWGSLTVSGNVFYGMTSEGGANNAGTLFSVDTNGTNYTDLHDFNFTGGDGYYGRGNLTLSANGHGLYGMTWEGGANGAGMIFSLQTNGAGYKDIYDFSPGVGSDPLFGSLTRINGTLYGLAEGGGAGGHGILFSIDTNGTNFRDLWDFGVLGNDGIAPQGSLALSGGQFFGMTDNGGLNNDGIVFSIDTNGHNYKILLNFNGTNGKDPRQDITISGRTLYGMTYGGGANNGGCVFSLDSTGTGYKDLFDFSVSGSLGYTPCGDLTVIGNTLFGMTVNGGANANGNLFTGNTNGTGFTDLVSFDGSLGGSSPNGNVIPVGNKIYGMTASGGDGAGNEGAGGVIFSYEIPGLGINNLKTADGKVSIYPNPNKGSFTLSLSNVNTKCEVEVYNTLGQKVTTSTLNTSTTLIDISGNFSGVYLYRVLSETGELISAGKFIIQ